MDLGQLKFLYLSSPSPFAYIFVTSSSQQRSAATCNLQLGLQPAIGETVDYGEEIREAVGFGEADNADVDLWKTSIWHFEVAD